VCIATSDGKLIVCDLCDAEYHMDCLQPPLEEEPADAWLCPPCAGVPAACAAYAAAAAEEQAKAAAAQGVPWAQSGARTRSRADLDAILEGVGPHRKTSRFQSALVAETRHLGEIDDAGLPVPARPTGGEFGALKATFHVAFGVKLSAAATCFGGDDAPGGETGISGDVGRLLLDFDPRDPGGEVATQRDARAGEIGRSLLLAAKLESDGLAVARVEFGESDLGLMAETLGRALGLRLVDLDMAD
jgi:hypothetical protein